MPANCNPLPPEGQLVELPTTQFTNSTQGFVTGDTITLELTVQTKEFCPQWMAIPDSMVDADWNVKSITGPAGANLLLSGQPMNTPFFSSKNQRGGQVASCCVPAGLKITVVLEYIGTIDIVGGVRFGAAFKGLAR